MKHGAVRTLLAAVLCLPFLAGCADATTGANPTTTVVPVPATTAPTPAGGSPAAPAAAGGSTYPTLAGGAVDQVVIAQGVDPTTLDPSDHNETPAATVLNNVYDALVGWTPDVKLAPRLAESWKQIDPTTWEFALRPGVKWQDGSDFSADDVKFTIDRYLDAKRKPRPLQRRANLKAIANVTVVDPNTVRITTTAPFPSLPNQLTTEPIISKKYATGPQGDAILAQAPMGTGPFKFVEWVKNDHIDLTVSSGFWGPAPKVQKVRFRTIPDAQTRLSALQAGDVDVITNVAPELVDQLTSSAKTAVSTAPSVRVIFIILNTLDSASPLSKSQVRQALNMAVDRDGIIKAILNGNGTKISQPLTDRHFGYNPNVPQYAFSVDKAKQMLAAAGYPNGFDLTFNYPSGRYLKDKEIGESVASQWADIGVKAKTASPVWTDYVGLINNRKQAQAFLLGWGNNTWDADNTLFTLLNTPKKDLTVADGSVYSYWVNDKVQQDIQKARTLSDPQQRNTLYQEANQIIHDDAPWVFLHQQRDIYAYNKSKITWQARSDEQLNAFEMAAAK